uniref:Uncharacterized protein n=1 Tax=Rhizophora mucronata TaxID=61149 RepID=A0A2P2Q6Y4_RHIMU
MPAKDKAMQKAKMLRNLSEAIGCQVDGIVLQIY